MISANSTHSRPARRLAPRIQNTHFADPSTSHHTSSIGGRRQYCTREGERALQSGRRITGLSSTAIIPPADDPDHNPDQTTGHEEIARDPRSAHFVDKLRRSIARYFLAFSPSATSRRIASCPGYCLVRRCCNPSINCRRASVGLPTLAYLRCPVPVAGRPRVFLVTFIDFFHIFLVTINASPGGQSFRPGSNPSHKGRKSNDQG